MYVFITVVLCSFKCVKLYIEIGKAYTIGIEIICVTIKLNPFTLTLKVLLSFLFSGIFGKTFIKDLCSNMPESASR